jgi:hypothetical protein
MALNSNPHSLADVARYWLACLAGHGSSIQDTASRMCAIQWSDRINERYEEQGGNNQLAVIFDALTDLSLPDGVYVKNSKEREIEWEAVLSYIGEFCGEYLGQAQEPESLKKLRTQVLAKQKFTRYAAVRYLQALASEAVKLPLSERDYYVDQFAINLPGLDIHIKHRDLYDVVFRLPELELDKLTEPQIALAPAANRPKLRAKKEAAWNELLTRAKGLGSK